MIFCTSDARLVTTNQRRFYTDQPKSHTVTTLPGSASTLLAEQRGHEPDDFLASDSGTERRRTRMLPETPTTTIARATLPQPAPDQ